jgi:pimeloyl-ACP methyl ester carboxylesterase
MDRFAADVDTALNAVDRASAHVFGFSLGSAVALQYAHDHPDRVGRLALLGPNATWTREQVEALPNGRLALLPGRAHRLSDPVVDLLAPLLRQHLSRAAPQE